MLSALTWQGSMNDETVIRALYADHGSALFRYALWLAGGDRRKADELVQEAMVRAARHAAELDPPRARSWLLAVTRSIAVDAHLASRTGQQEPENTVPGEMPAGDQPARAVQALIVTEALASLEPDQLAVVVELYYRGRSVEEAATALGIPPDTVKSRASTALKVLAKVLREIGVTGSVKP